MQTWPKMLIYLITIRLIWWHLDHWQMMEIEWGDLMFVWKFKCLFGNKCGGIQSSKDVNKFEWQGWPPFSAYQTGSRWHWRRRLCQTWTWTTWGSKTQHVPWPPTSPTSLVSCPSPPAEPKSRFAFSSVCQWSWQRQRWWQLGLFCVFLCFFPHRKMVTTSFSPTASRPFSCPTRL